MILFVKAQLPRSLLQIFLQKRRRHRQRNAEPANRLQRNFADLLVRLRSSSLCSHSGSLLAFLMLRLSSFFVFFVILQRLDTFKGT